LNAIRRFYNASVNGLLRLGKRIVARREMQSRDLLEEDKDGFERRVLKIIEEERVFLEQVRQL
jgi:hypothetical protein